MLSHSCPSGSTFQGSLSEWRENLSESSVNAAEAKVMLRTIALRSDGKRSDTRRGFIVLAQRLECSAFITEAGYMWAT